MIERQITFAYPILSLLLVMTATASESASASDQVVWSGDGQYRLLVRIEASEPAGRATDELPAELQIDFAAELDKLGIDALPDIGSVQVMQYDAETGQPKNYANYGHVLWWPNCGTKREPKFTYSKFAVNADGLPLDVGMSASPKVVDWDGDGVKDLLVGANWNRILFYKNTGTDRDRTLVCRGPVLIGELPLELPLQPLTRGKSEIFKRDYYPILETVDWDDDGDGDLDLVVSSSQNIYMFTNEGSKTEPKFMTHANHLPSSWGLASISANQFRDWDGGGRLDPQFERVLGMEFCVSIR